MGRCVDPSAGGVQIRNDLLVLMEGWMDGCLRMGCGARMSLTACLSHTPACAHLHMKCTNNDTESEIYTEIKSLNPIFFVRD